MLFALFAVLLSLPALADQTTIPDFDTARDDFVWPLFYVFGGETVDYGVPFGPNRHLDLANETLTVEHVYPADYIAEAKSLTPVDLRSGRSPRRRNYPRNLWAALLKTNGKAVRGRISLGRRHHCPITGQIL